MDHYRSNRRDLEFVLFELLGRGEILGDGPYADLDEDTARAILDSVEHTAHEVMAPSFIPADRNPATFDAATGTVTLPAELTETIASVFAGDWHDLELPSHLGGLGLPASLRWAGAEMMLGANPTAFLYLGGPGFAAILDALGTDAQRSLARTMIERNWGSTMVLTEPDAGSDVGAGRTTATEQPDGTWHITGVKRFITGGDWDWPENIVHLVLARPVGAGPGTKGLSLFVVPKFHVHDDGSIGERNGVVVTNVERKMGIKSSATCEVTFGADRPAVGTLVGDVHDGIAQMFKIIQFARMMVGTKAIATLSTGYLNALDYARTRVQGADLLQSTDKTAPRVTIIHHPDVRRMLMLQKSYAEGLRALVLFAAAQQDAVAIAEAKGERAEDAIALNDLLLPLIKGVGSERSFEMLALSLQTLGGSGYLQDYPMEQYLRDAKIDTLYEGTTGIQGLDFFFRKIVRDKGAALSRMVSEIVEFAKSDAGNGQLATERQLLLTAVEDVGGIVGAMVDALRAAEDEPRAAYRAGLNTTRLLMAAGDVMIGYLLLRSAVVALDALAAGTSAADRPFYEGKVAAARFFASQRLPLLTAERHLAETTDLALMDVAEDAF